MQDDLVGYIVRGNFICLTCQSNSDLDDPPPVKVYRINLGSYSQSCSNCGKKIIEGQFKTELFGSERDPNEFAWADMLELLIQFDTALHQEDFEAVASVRRNVYEKTLKAVIVDKLRDRKMVLDAVERIIQTQSAW